MHQGHVARDAAIRRVPKHRRGGRAGQSCSCLGFHRPCLQNTPSSHLRALTPPQVKSRYKLHCPPECPKEVYERLMWPCWAADPRKRPGFRELRDALLDLGVVAQEEPPPVDDDAADTGRTRQNTLRRERAHSGAGRGAPPPDEWSLRGPSVHHVASVLVPRVYDLTNDRCGSPAAVVVIQNVCSCLHSLCW